VAVVATCRGTVANSQVGAVMGSKSLPPSLLVRSFRLLALQKRVVLLVVVLTGLVTLLTFSTMRGQHRRLDSSEQCEHPTVAVVIRFSLAQRKQVTATLESVLAQQGLSLNSGVAVLLRVHASAPLNAIQAANEAAAMFERVGTETGRCTCCFAHVTSDNLDVAARLVQARWVLQMSPGDTIHPSLFAKVQQSEAATPPGHSKPGAVIPSVCSHNGQPLRQQARRVSQIDTFLHHALPSEFQQSPAPCTILRRVDALLPDEGTVGWGWETEDIWVRTSSRSKGLRFAVIADLHCGYTIRDSKDVCQFSKKTRCATAYGNPACEAAAVVAGGGIYPLEMVQGAWKTLRKPASAKLLRFLTLPVVQPAFTLPPPAGLRFADTPTLNSLFTALLAELDGDWPKAQTWYRNCLDIAPRHLPTIRTATLERGLVWQAVYGLTSALPRHHNLSPFLDICTTAIATIFAATNAERAVDGLPPSGKLPPAVAAQWTASGCDAQAFMPPQLKYIDVPCSPKGGTLTPTGECRCVHGWIGADCSRRAQPMPVEKASKVRVCMLTIELEHFVPGRTGVSVSRMAQHLKRQGFQVRVLLAEYLHIIQNDYQTVEKGKEEWQKKGIPVDILEWDNKLWGYWFLRRVQAAYNMAVRFEDQCDVLHFPVYLGLGYMVTMAKHNGVAFRNTLLVAQAHGPYSFGEQRSKVLFLSGQAAVQYTEAYSMQHADIVLTASAFLAHHLSTDFDIRKLHILQNLHAPSASGSPPAKVRHHVTELAFWGELLVTDGLGVFCEKIVDGLLTTDVTLTVVHFLPSLEVRVDHGSDGPTLIRRFSSKWADHGVEVRIHKPQPAATHAQFLMENPQAMVAITSEHASAVEVLVQCLENFVPFVAPRVAQLQHLVADDDALAVLGPIEELFELTRASFVDGAIVPRPSMEMATKSDKWLALHLLPVAPVAHVPMTVAFPVEAKAPSGAPLVSIIVTSYNRPAKVPEAIQSSFEQSYAAIEVVIVDDHSTHADMPNTLNNLEVQFSDANNAKAFPGKTRKLTIVRNPQNMYLGAARNIGVEAASGDLLAFLDDDDEMLPHAIETLVTTMRNTNADIVGGRPWCFNPGTPKEQAGDIQLLGGPMESIFKNSLGGPLVLVRRASMRTLGGYTTERTGCEDYELLVRAVIMNLRWERAVLPIYWYIVDAPGSMLSAMSKYDCSQRILRWFKGMLDPRYKFMPEVVRAFYEEAQAAGRVE